MNVIGQLWRGVGFGAIVAVCGASALAGRPVDAASPDRLGPRSASTQPASQPGGAASAALSRMIPKFQLKNVEFQFAVDSVAEWVANSTEARLDVRWRYITRAGIHPSREVSVDLKDKTVAEVLDALIRAAGGSDRLIYDARGEVIVLTSTLGRGEP